MISFVLASMLVLQAPTGPDPIRVSFAFCGCNRLDKDDWTPIAKEVPSSANVPELLQTLRDIDGMKRKPDWAFFVGDMVLGYGDDQGEAAQAQLEAWTKLVKGSGFSLISKLIPVPGNHELNKKSGKLKLPNPPTVAMWAKWYRASGWTLPGSNGPSPGQNDMDALAVDQRTLSYSFDSKNVHFVVLNTDTATTAGEDGGKTRVAYIPANWAAKDIAKAEKDPKVREIFVMGHRNLVDPASCTGDSPIDKEAAGTLLTALKQSKKFRAYLCAHVHGWDLKRIEGTPAGWQVIAGNAGSTLEPDWKPKEGCYFGFSVIDVTSSGKVVLHNYRRPIPASKQPGDLLPQAKRSPAKPVDSILYDSK